MGEWTHEIEILKRNNKWYSMTADDFGEPRRETDQVENVNNVGLDFDEDLRHQRFDGIGLEMESVKRNSPTDDAVHALAASEPLTNNPNLTRFRHGAVAENCHV